MRRCLWVDIMDPNKFRYFQIKRLKDFLQAFSFFCLGNNTRWWFKRFISSIYLNYFYLKLIVDHTDTGKPEYTCRIIAVCLKARLNYINRFIIASGRLATRISLWTHVKRVFRQSFGYSLSHARAHLVDPMGKPSVTGGDFARFTPQRTDAFLRDDITVY